MQKKKKYSWTMIGTWTICLTFCRQYSLQIHFPEWNLWYFDSNFMDVDSLGSNGQVTIGSGNGLAPNMWLRSIYLCVTRPQLVKTAAHICKELCFYPKIYKIWQFCLLLIDLLKLLSIKSDKKAECRTLAKTLRQWGDTEESMIEIIICTGWPCLPQFECVNPECPGILNEITKHVCSLEMHNIFRNYSQVPL